MRIFYFFKVSYNEVLTIILCNITNILLQNNSFLKKENIFLSLLK